MLMITDGTAIMEPEDAAKEFPKILRNQPKQMLEKYKLVTPRALGKSTSACTAVFSILAAVAGHAQRMRGRYVHSRKGKYLRRHTQRVSFLD